MKKNDVYIKAKSFIDRNPGTVVWRLKAHCKVAQDLINDDEEVLYAFAAQKNASSLDIISTHVVVVTSKRLVVAQKRLIFGYFYYSITPDMFNDFTIKKGLIWGNAIIDTLKETVILSNLSGSALREIETVMTKYMMQKKRELNGNVTEEEKEGLSDNLKKIAQDGE